MAEKIKLTRPELKKQRETLARYERYLPTLKLKQQQLQIAVIESAKRFREAEALRDKHRKEVEKYSRVFSDRAGLNLAEAATPKDVDEDIKNVAGVRLPVFKGIVFKEFEYSLFSTPPWVDTAMMDLRKLAELKVICAICKRELDLLTRELTRINQRLNLFEKVMIPKARRAILKIRIYLGDEQTAAVGRAKIAKGKQSRILKKGEGVIPGLES